MTAEQALQAIEEALEQHPCKQLNVLFMGGEPFVALPILKAIVATCRERFADKNIHFKAISNGTLIHGEVQEWLNANADLFEVTLSVDGDRETHNKHRCNSYDRIDFKYFHEVYPRSVTFNMVVTPDTLPLLAENVIRYAEQGIYCKTVLADGVDWQLERDVPVLERELKKLVDYYVSHPNSYPTALLNFAIYALDESIPIHPCRPGVTSECIMPDGQHIPCYRCSPFFGDQTGKVLRRLDHTDHFPVATAQCADCCVKRVCNACPAQVASLEGTEEAHIYCALQKVLFKANAYMATQLLLHTPEAAYLRTKSPEQKQQLLNNAITILNQL